MAKTIAQRIAEEMESEGYELAGKTSGWFSTRKGSNLSRKLEQLDLTIEEVEVRTGAKKQHQTEGTDLLIFKKK